MRLSIPGSRWIRDPIERIASFIYRFFPGADLGRRGEAAAARHLRKQGLRIMARNFRVRSGEIDIVALEGGTLVLVEVKSALAPSRGDPLGKISPEKARRIRRAASLCRKIAGEEFPSFRIDGIVVNFKLGFGGRPVPRSIRWYPDLYPAEEREL